MIVTAMMRDPFGSFIFSSNDITGHCAAILSASDLFLRFSEYIYCLQADSGINPVNSPANYWIDWGGGKGTTVERMERRVDRRPS